MGQEFRGMEGKKTYRDRDVAMVFDTCPISADA